MPSKRRPYCLSKFKFYKRTRFLNSLFLLLALATLNACSFNRTVGKTASRIAHAPLLTPAFVSVDYSPSTHTSISWNAEFFNKVRQDEALRYGKLFEERLDEYNIILNNDSAQYHFEVSSIYFKETTRFECQMDTATYKQYCYWLNELKASVKIKIHDLSSGLSETIVTHSRENTYIRKRLFEDGYIESGSHLYSSQLISKMVGTCFIKGIGKSTEFIKDCEQMPRIPYEYLGLEK